MIRYLASQGAEQEFIARVVGTSVDTLVKHCRADLNSGVEQVHLEVGAALIKQIQAGNIAMPGMASATSAGRIAHCRPSMRNRSPAVARSSVHCIGGRNSSHTDARSEATAIAIARPSRARGDHQRDAAGRSSSAGNTSHSVFGMWLSRRAAVVPTATYSRPATSPDPRRLFRSAQPTSDARSPPGARSTARAATASAASASDRRGGAAADRSASRGDTPPTQSPSPTTARRFR